MPLRPRTQGASLRRKGHKPCRLAAICSPVCLPAAEQIPDTGQDLAEISE